MILLIKIFWQILIFTLGNNFKADISLYSLKTHKNLAKSANKKRKMGIMLEQLDKQTLQHIIETSPIGLFLTDSEGKVSWFNPTLAHLIDEPNNPFTGQTEQSINDELKPLFSEQGVVHIQCEDEPNKHFICTKQPLENGMFIHFVHDASTMQQLFHEREELKSIIEEMKAIDPLTGMPNNQAILNALEPQVSRSRRYGNVLSVMITQITNLKEIQDKIGEPQTDELILACSHMLNDQVRWADMIGHINDHEFLLILPETGEDDTHKLKDILIERFSAIQVGDMAEKNVNIKTDFGITQWRKGMDVPLLMQSAREFLDEEPQEQATA